MCFCGTPGLRWFLVGMEARPFVRVSGGRARYLVTPVHSPSRALQEHLQHPSQHPRRPPKPPNRPKQHNTQTEEKLNVASDSVQIRTVAGATRALQITRGSMGTPTRGYVRGGSKQYRVNTSVKVGAMRGGGLQVPLTWGSRCSPEAAT